VKYLPSLECDFKSHQKLNTYLTLSRIGCPVFKSIVIENEMFVANDITAIKNHLHSDFCTIRYQYIKPTSSPVRGGNKIPLDYSILSEKLVPDTLLWLLEPIDRLKNLYGINMGFNRQLETLTFECVGKGFDVSDLNRGDVTPHQRIEFRLPIMRGWYNEWWKYAHFYFATHDVYEDSKLVRLKKLKLLGIDAETKIFEKAYKPLSLSVIEKMLDYALLLDDYLASETEFVVSCSIDFDEKIIFWEIQTPLEKMKILGGRL